ncbi:flavin reductase [Nitratireductor sp. CAU 1489]|uniref:Flavin reductase n=1 Tax=Nitratireductor arenosus TaxID=2682096 RepID=A0A844QEB9_9HYPH|nr:flavin reductase [Nitratireductor arenosus]
MLKKSEIEPRHYRDAMAQFAGAVHVITTDGPFGRRGVTAIAACSVTDNPPTILVCLNRENENNDCFLRNGVFALNTLAASHEALSSDFSGLTGKSQDARFAAAEWDRISTGAPVLKGALAVFDCEIVDTKELGTHRVYFGRVTGLDIGDSLDPLVYHNRAYRVL